MSMDQRFYDCITLLILGFLFWVVLDLAPFGQTACPQSEVLLRTHRPAAVSCVAGRPQ